MLDHLGITFPNSRCDQQVFNANASADGNNWRTWNKPRGVTFIHIFMIGAGGGGGEGAVGAASTAGGGGGGSSGGQSSLLIPALHLPDVLFVSVARGNGSNSSTSVSAGFTSYVSIIANQGAPASRATVLSANAGGSGGKANAGTGGALGTAASASGVSSCCLAGLGVSSFLGGQAGIVGGAAVAGGGLTLPTTGLCFTGGTGGGGLPAANNAGTAGGLINGVSLTQVPVNIPGGTGGTTAPTGGNNGQSGTRPFKGLM